VSTGDAVADRVSGAKTKTAPPRVSRRRRARASALKAPFVVTLYQLARLLPRPVTLLLFRAMTGLLRACYRLPFNPLRRGAEVLAQAIRRHGGPSHAPRAIYDRFCEQARAVGEAYLDVMKLGPGSARRRDGLDPTAVSALSSLLETHGGVVLAVTHNVGAVYGALPISRALPTLVVAKNQKIPRLEALARSFLGRMQVDAYLARDLGKVELARICLRALRHGKLLVATMDLLHRKPKAIRVRILGQEVGLAPWAFRFAAKTRTPVIPCYVAMHEGRVGAWLGEALIPKTQEEAAQHYARWFERFLFADPGSWAFFMDKRWRAVLRRAAEGSA